MIINEQWKLIVKHRTKSSRRKFLWILKANTISVDDGATFTLLVHTFIYNKWNRRVPMCEFKNKIKMFENHTYLNRRRRNRRHILCSRDRRMGRGWIWDTHTQRIRRLPPTEPGAPLARGRTRDWPWNPYSEKLWRGMQQNENPSTERSNRSF